MLFKYVYKNKKTGKLIHTNKRLDESKWELVRVIKDGMMKSNQVTKKNG